MLSARDVIAGVLGEHYWGSFRTGTRFEYRCWCGWTPVRPREQSEHFAHLTDALIAAGVTVPVEDCKDGCMWRIPNRVEDMTPRQRELLRRDE